MTRAALVGIGLSLLFCVTVAPVWAQGTKTLRLTDAEKKILDLTNAARKKEGLSPLAPDPRLFALARKHSANMGRQQKLAHTLDGKSPFQRMRESGYTYYFAGENVANGNWPVEKIFQLWMNSPAHRKNILSPQFTVIGIGQFVDDRGVSWFTQVFARPKKTR